MEISSKPARRIAIISLIFSVIFFGITFFVGRWSGFFAVSALSWLILSAALVWFVLALQFHQRSLAEQEKLDISHLAKTDQDSTIFQTKTEHPELFAVAQRRLELFEKWFLPIFSAIIAVYQAAIGLYLLKAIFAVPDVEPEHPLVCAISATVVAFFSFLISRYATGMSAQQQWKALRAGGSYMLSVAVVCFVLAVGLALAQFKIFIVLAVIGWVILILLVLLAVESALNIVMDIYRPRLKDQYTRSAFDSRLLGTISETGGIFRTAAGAIDYQFGFKVSQTWFYKLLEKAVVPLILFAALTLYLLSCVVVVQSHEQAIIEHFGNPLNEAKQVRILGPGLAFKWPWPIDIVRKYSTQRISQINIGFVPKPRRIDPKTNRVIPEPLLWGESHHEQEFELLVASEHSASALESEVVPVSLLIVAIPVQYKVKDLYSFLYNHIQPEKRLESICYQELTKFAASAKIEVDDKATMGASLLGAGRADAKKLLTERIQTAADKAGLGVEIVFLGVQGIHPPAKVAADYQAVVGAVQKKQKLIFIAEADRNRTLSTLAGSVEDANGLYTLALEYQLATEQNNTQKIEELGPRLDLAFTQASGEIFKTLRQAETYAFEKEILAQATGQRFASQLAAYNAGKEIYKREQLLSVLEESLSNIRKYVVVADPNDKQIFIIDVKEKLTPTLYDIAGIEETSRK